MCSAGAGEWDNNHSFKHEIRPGLLCEFEMSSALLQLVDFYQYL